MACGSEAPPLCGPSFSLSISYNSLESVRERGRCTVCIVIADIVKDRERRKEARNEAAGDWERVGRRRMWKEGEQDNVGSDTRREGRGSEEE
jgi:hypothetical protein